MNLTVRDVRIGNSEISGCTPTCLRDDSELITPSEQKISSISQMSLYVLQHTSGMVPSIILEAKIFALAAASSLGVGVIVGAASGILKNKAADVQTYSSEWYYWMLTPAAQKPCTRFVLGGIQLASSAGNTAATIFWKPTVAAAVNGVSSGFSAGYHIGRFGVELLSKNTTTEEQTPLV